MLAEEGRAGRTPSSATDEVAPEGAPLPEDVGDWIKSVPDDVVRELPEMLWRRRQVAEEMLSTEITYVRHLQDIVMVYSTITFPLALA